MKSANLSRFAAYNEVAIGLGLNHGSRSTQHQKKRLIYMHRRIVSIAMATLFSLSAAGNSYAAPPAPFHHHTSSDKPSTGKMIRFNIRNDSSNAVVLKSGDQQYTIEAGKSLAMQLQDGAEVVAVSGTSKDAPGTVITKVSNVLKGNTLVVS